METFAAVPDEIPHAVQATLLVSLREMNLIDAGAQPRLIPLTGGVSSLIARVEDGSRVFCVKRALETLRVAADWHVPVERNRAEVAWMREAGLIAPMSVPMVLGEDPLRNAFAMAYLEPESHPVWKNELLAGRVSAAFAAAVGHELGRIHAATADREDLAHRFATDANFYALRLEPYFEASAQAHPDLERDLLNLSTRTAATKRVLVHGDISPKNILVHSGTPVFLDAECAWYGDPAFDLAFCTNHLALKAVHNWSLLPDLRLAFEQLCNNYFAQVTWEDRCDLEQRAATLMPALALARIDGKSPVDYLDGTTRHRVRAAARNLIVSPVRSMAELWHCWQELLS